MAQFINFGRGIDGTVPSSGTYAGTNLSCAGASGTTTINYSGSFTDGDLVLIHQSRGSGVGAWEINQITAANTVAIPLSYTYTDSGNSQAQIIEIKEYLGGDISGTLTGNAWDGNVGGIIPIMCSGTLTVSGSISLNALGMRGGTLSISNDSQQGEGDVGAGVTSQSANGGGGGGGSDPGFGGGGGGGHASTGSAGSGSGNGAAGAATGQSDLSFATLGNGGGKGGDSLGGNGGTGGGGLFVFANNFVVTGGITLTGSAGSGTDPGSPTARGGGGGGSGGFFMLKAGSATIGSSLITSLGGSGGAGVTGGGTGGAGSVGRIRLEVCSLSGATNPSASSSIGGFSYCNTIFGGVL